MKVEILEQKGNYFLWIDDFLWMWDIESERKIQYGLAHEAYGDVFVAGYGLGLVQRYLCNNPNVKSVTTVEISKEIIEACQNKFEKIYGDYIIEDFYNIFSDTKCDCIIGIYGKKLYQKV